MEYVSLNGRHALTFSSVYFPEGAMDIGAEVEVSCYAFKCETCQKTFVSKKTLHNHYKVHGDRYYRCQQCGRTFFRKFELERHITTHGNQKHYTCDRCGQSYKSQAALLNHETAHYKRFICMQCGESYKYAPGLRKHQQKAHQEHSKCEFCGHLFKDIKGHKATCKDNLTREDCHTSCTCKQCGKKFKLRRYLTTHIKNKHGDISKKYECQLCAKLFRYKQSLYEHSKKCVTLDVNANVCIFQNTAPSSSHLSMPSMNAPLHTEFSRNSRTFPITNEGLMLDSYADLGSMASDSMESLSSTIFKATCVLQNEDNEMFFQGVEEN
jgi:hypothetical protein